MTSPYFLLDDAWEIPMTTDANFESGSSRRAMRGATDEPSGSNKLFDSATPLPENWPEGVQVFCLGSPHGDDQIGWLAGEALRKQVPEGASRIHFLNHAWQLAGYLDRCHRAILIDACCPVGEAETGLKKTRGAGTIMRMGWPDPRLRLLRSHSTHRSSVAEALELAETLDWLPSEVLVLGIVADRFELGSGPSPEMIRSIPQVIQVVLAEVFRP